MSEILQDADTEGYIPPTADLGISDNPYCNDADCDEPNSRAMRWHDELVAMQSSKPANVVWEMLYPSNMPTFVVVTAPEFVRSEKRAKQIADQCQTTYGVPAKYRPLAPTGEFK